MRTKKVKVPVVEYAGEETLSLDFNYEFKFKVRLRLINKYK